MFRTHLYSITNAGDCTIRIHWQCRVEFFLYCASICGHRLLLVIHVLLFNSEHARALLRLYHLNSPPSSPSIRHVIGQEQLMKVISRCDWKTMGRVTVTRLLFLNNVNSRQKP